MNDRGPAEAGASGLSGAYLSLGSMAPLLDMMAASRLTPERVLTRAGLPADLFTRPGDTPVPLADYFRLCEQMALQGDDESCHISLRPLMVGTSELVQARLRGCRTLSQVLEVLANSYNIIHGDRYNRVVRRHHRTVYEIDDTDFPYALGADEPFVLLSLECLLVYVHALVMSAAPDAQGVTLQRITTRGNDRASGNHLDFWQAPVQRGAALFSLVYAGDLDQVAVTPEESPVITGRTIYGGVADMLDRLQPPARKDQLADRVERLILQGQDDQAEVSRILGLSVASLRRALQDEGASFRDLRAEALNRKAQAALQDGTPVGDVAEMLGFSDGRSFARAFRQWNGMSPSDYFQRSV